MKTRHPISPHYSQQAPIQHALPPKPFPSTLRALRKLAGLSQPACAALLGCSVRSVSKWENGDSAPAAFSQPAILAKLKVAAKRLKP